MRLLSLIASVTAIQLNINRQSSLQIDMLSWDKCNANGNDVVTYDEMIECGAPTNSWFKKQYICIAGLGEYSFLTRD